MADASLVFANAEVRAYAKALFEKAGWSARDATITADHLITADLSGHPSHGMGMIPSYVEGMERGGLKPSNRIEEKLRAGSLLVLAGNTALGQPAAHDAVEAGASIAREHGIALVNLIQAHHIGRIGHYAEQAARHGMIGLYWVNVATTRAAVAPFGGRERRYGTNPQAIGIPRPGAQPFLLDFATSRIAVGKTRVAWLQHKKTPFGALIDGKGEPTDDPGVMFPDFTGALAPFGDHKGYGLAMASEILSSILGGGETIAESRDKDTIHNSMLAIIIDPAKFESVAGDWRARVERFIEWTKSSQPAAGVAEVLVAGDPEFRSRAAYGDRVRYDEESWAQIAAAGRRVGLGEAEIPKPRQG
ncbi:MAG: malate/lactate/ureidoglycolate dehydrogenase [Rhizobiales bacterium]|nr:malate/lactate/ureidoglycolate dehydrogenase [Hyphomicrobiales bacterium]